jgi:hypothetical protein
MPNKASKPGPLPYFSPLDIAAGGFQIAKNSLIN